MSVGKVVTGFLGKQDKDVLLHILDEQSAGTCVDVAQSEINYRS